MSRYIITETEEEKQFLVKNMFSLYRNKITKDLRFINNKGELLFKNNELCCKERQILLVTNGNMWLTNNNGEFINLVCFNKRNKYQSRRHNVYSLHHKCFDELIEWLKYKQDSGYVL